MPPAARIADMHTCPMSTGPVPHVGGPIMVGCPTVLIGGMPAARVGDMVTCCGPPDTIAMGSTGVMIGGMPAARMGDLCAHGGTITVGFPQVMIGEMGGPPSPSALAGMAASAAQSLTLPKIKAGKSGLFGSFLSGFKSELFSWHTVATLAMRAAVVTLECNPEVAAGCLAAYGAVQLYVVLEKSGNGNPWEGAKNIGSALAHGNPQSLANLAGRLTAAVVVGEAGGGTDAAEEGAEAAMTGARTAQTAAKVDEALAEDATAVEGAAAESTAAESSAAETSAAESAPPSEEPEATPADEEASADDASSSDEEEPESTKQKLKNKAKEAWKKAKPVVDKVRPVLKAYGYFGVGERWGNHEAD